MKIFLSWSGARSKAVAEIFSDWLKCVIQASQPWISTRDIDRGAIWFSEINDKLKDVSIGVICLTQENKDRPWILFETGALAKGLSTNRVCTFLIDLNPEDVQDPLAQFNHTVPAMQSVWGLVKTINMCLLDKALDERILKQVFDTYWPQFENSFNLALQNNPPEEDVPPRTDEDILNEILKTTRSLSNRMAKLEGNSYKPKYIGPDKNSIIDNDINFLKDSISKVILRGFTDENEILSILNTDKYPRSFLRTLINDELKNTQTINIKQDSL